MSDSAVETITKFLNSPPGAIVAGGALFFGVPKIFKEIEERLTDHTKLGIALWLLDRKGLSPVVQNWPGTFCKVFDRVFGNTHFTWKCFWRSAITSYAGLFIVSSYIDRANGWRLLAPDNLLDTARYGFTGNVLPDFVSLIETRYVLGLMQRTKSGLKQAGFIFLDFVLTSGIAVITAHMVLSSFWPDSPLSWNWSIPAIFGHPTDFHQTHTWLSIVIPAFLTSIWLWLYAFSGFLLRAAHKFDIGFEWFNRRFDIEKKPLQSIGVVSGVLLAIVYWIALALSSAFGLKT